MWKKSTYDRFGHAGLDQNGGGQGGAGFSDVFGDVFGDIFGGGGGRGRSGPARGSDLRYDLQLDLEHAVKGKTVQIEVPTMTHCDPCGGSGARKGTSPVTCDTCGGVGQVRMSQGFSLFSKRAQPVVVAARRSRTPAVHAMVRALKKSVKHFPLRFLPVLILGIEFVCQER